VDVIAARLERAYPDTNAEEGLLPLQTAFAERYRTSFGLLGGGTAAILLNRLRERRGVAVPCSG
jgi:hypothetical protein